MFKISGNAWVKNVVFVTEHTRFPLLYPTNSWGLLSNQLRSPGGCTPEITLGWFLTTTSLFLTENYFRGCMFSGQEERNPARWKLELLK